MSGAHVVLRTDRGIWTVGHYDPEGEWQPHEDFDSKESAESVCHYLNGGNAPGFSRRMVQIVSELQGIKSLLEGRAPRNPSLDWALNSGDGTYRP